MLTILVCMLIFPFMAIVVLAREEEWASKLIAGFMGTLVGTIIGLVVCILVGQAFPAKLAVYQETELVALRTADSVSGHFFLGTGNIGNQGLYVYWVETENGGFQQRRLKDEGSVLVFEDVDLNDTERPKLVTLHRKFVNHRLDLWLLPGGMERFEFHIPPGSLVRSYQLE